MSRLHQAAWSRVFNAKSPNMMNESKYIRRFLKLPRFWNPGFWKESKIIHTPIISFRNFEIFKIQFLLAYNCLKTAWWYHYDKNMLMTELETYCHQHFLKSFMFHEDKSSRFQIFGKFIFSFIDVGNGS